jgi:predicted ATPase/DNA-binding winged helix-turn-helix (wHTH) protein
MDVVAFGQFRLFVSRRLLVKDGVPLKIGGRALDLLIALVQRAGDVVGKKELMETVWRGLAVDEGSLRVNITALRKILEDGENGGRFITNVPSRGYSFVASIEILSVIADHEPNQIPAPPTYRLPPPLARMLGRDEVVTRLRQELALHRFVSVVGPGGIGKTTVALAVAHQELSALQGAVRFIDLGPISESVLIPSAIASSLGLVVRSGDPVTALLNFLEDKHVLLIFDSCEHLVDDVAALAERIFDAAPNVLLLVTTRETLRVEGEYVHRLEPLSYPPDEETLTPAAALGFPATQLFFERAAASGGAFSLTEDDALLAAEVCRKLDGLALAIQLAAGRVGTYGMRQTADLIDGQMKLLWHGRRTAPPRHQTLRATLDWSYDLLSAEEQIVLRRLSIFLGSFSLEAACLVVSDVLVPQAAIAEILANLVAKSLVVSTASRPQNLFRLLDTTRAYTLAKMTDDAEMALVQRQHARYFTELLAARSARVRAAQQPEDLTKYLPHLANVRSALAWSFGPEGDKAIAIRLAGVSSRLLLDLSLLTESSQWAERGIALLADHPQIPGAELDLQASYAQALMFTRGNLSEPKASFVKALELAKGLHDPYYELEILGGLHLFEERTGNFRSSLRFAEQSEAVARHTGDQTAIDAAVSFVGLCHHLMGNHQAADRCLRAALPSDKGPSIDRLMFGFHFRNRTAITFARHLWLRGHCQQAVALARSTVAEAEKLSHPITLGIASIWAVSVFIWNEDFASAESEADRFLLLAKRHSLAPWIAAGHGVKAQLAIKRGDVDAGMIVLEKSLQQLRADKYELLSGEFSGTLAEGALAKGDFDDALRRSEEAVALVERNGDLFFLPELLRIRGEILAAHPKFGAEMAEGLFLAAVDRAQEQGALSWELRSAQSLAQIWRAVGRTEEATSLLSNVRERLRCSPAPGH